MQLPSVLSKMRLVRVHLSSVDSTNSYARRCVKDLDAAAITVITTDEQTGGRGRNGRTWVSSGDDIKATFAFKIPQSALATAYQLSPFMSIVARRALHKFGVNIQIKWPNDLIVKD